MKVRVFTLKERNHNMKRKIALVVGSTFLCASILSGCASATPVDKYLRSFDKGDSEAASQIYSEEIKDNAEDKEALQTKLKERMDSIYENFKSGKITSDEAKEKLKSYKEYDTSSVYAFTTMSVPYSANVAVFKKIVLHWILSSQMIPAQSSQRAVTFSVCLEKDSMLLSLTNCSNCCEKMLWIIFETTV